MDEDFELQYADELDAIEDFEPPGYSPQKFKRTLKFESPKAKKISNDITEDNPAPGDDLDSSLLTPLDSPGAINGSLLHGSSKKSRLSDALSGKGRSEKRLRSQDEFTLLSDEEFGDIPSPEAPSRKRARHEDVPAASYMTNSNSVVSPPQSPSTEDKILQLRAKKNKKQSRTGTDSRFIQDYDFERQRVHHRIPDGDFIGATGMDGERVYIRVKDEITLDREFDEVGKSVKRSQLLSMSIEDLKEQIETERQDKLLQDAERLTQQIHRDAEGNLSDGSDDDIEDDSLAVSKSDLWVDKYAPHRYTDLLSEENINRTLLHWLKLWDYVVFDKEVPLKNKDKKKQNKDIKKKKWQPEVMEDLDKFNRPIQKVALLNGPPGLGKTTLAHVIARHSGYSVVEINASDDRSAETFKNKLEAATQMKAVLGADPRPNCLIIDEIDGAPVAAINVLLNLIKRTDEHDAKKKKKEGDMLLRPIICICNDQYVPALRQLRQVALVINFPQTEPAKLASRLYQVVRHEHLKADMNTLLALCDKSDNDIRSCLNTLQFLQRQGKELSLRLVQTMNVGHKDSQKSLFSVWYDIFSMPRPKKNRFLNIQDLRNSDLRVHSTSIAGRFQDILQTTLATGDYEKINQGLFENYLQCKFKDPKMDGLNFALDWMCFVDEITEYINHKQDYCLMPYIPYVSVTFHLLCASNQVPKVQYPHSQYEAVTKLTKSSNLVIAMMSDMLPRVRKFLNLETTVMEVLSPLLEIIQPTLRPVNTQLYSAREKEELAQLIRIMIAYNMTYHQEKSVDGQYFYSLDPKVDEVVKFTGMKQQKQLTYAAKQLIAREIELEKLRKNDAGRGETSRSSNLGSKPAAQKDKGETYIPNHKQRLEAKPLTAKQEDEQVVRDFFGRIIKKKVPDVTVSKTTDEKEEKSNVLDTDIWFHFKEGFSNAVRRNVRVQDFL